MPVSSFMRSAPVVETPRAAASGDPLPSDLAEALEELAQAREEAREDGFPEPSDAALSNAERLLRAIHGNWPGRYWVYPTQDGEIAIDTPGGLDGSVVFLCESKGGALCLVNIGGRRRHKTYPAAPARPDAFLSAALEELTAWGRGGRRRGA